MAPLTSRVVAAAATAVTRAGLAVAIVDGPGGPVVGENGSSARPAQRKWCVRLLLVVLVVSGLILAACGVPTDQRPTATAAGPTVRSGVPAMVIPESTWARGRVRIDYPDGLAALGGAVFVKTDDGHVVRVQAASRTVGADVKVDTTRDPDHYCQGIGTDGRTLWACSAADSGTTNLVELDPETLQVRATVRIDKIFDQLAIPIVGRTAWVLTGTGSTLTALDTVTRRTRSYPLGRRCLQVAATTRTVYLTCRLSNEVVALAPGSGKIRRIARVDAPVNVVAGPDGVWVSGSGGLVRLSADLQVLETYPGLLAGPDGDLLLTSGSLWIRQGAGFLLRLDTTRSVVAARYAIDPLPSGGSLLEVGKEIWTSSYDDDLVLVVDARR